MPEQWSSSALESLLEHSVGGIWGKEVGGDDIDVSVVRSTNFTADGSPNLHDVARRSITQKQLVSRELREGDILLEKSGGGPKQPVGRVLFINQDMPETVCANFVQLVRCDKAKILPKFLFLKFWLDHSNGVTERFQAATTGIRNLRTKDYLARTLNFPPIAEQRRIVDLVESIDNYIDALERQIDATRTARQGVLSELLSNPGDGWLTTTLSDLSKHGLLTDGDWVESKDQDQDGDNRLLQLADVGDGVFLNKSDRWMNDEQFARLDCTPVEVGDILIARMPDPIARACQVPENLPRSCVAVDVAICRLPEDSANPKFLVMLVNDWRFRSAAQARATGTTRKRVSRKNLAAIEFELPPPIEQHRIMNLVGSFDDQISALETQIDAARGTRSGVLSELLSGDRLLDESYDKAVGW